MGNFQKGGNRGGGFRGGNDRGHGGDRGGDRGGFQKKSWGGGDRDRGPVTMHRAVCADCGQSCEVPFRPVGDKPVFCNNCFGGKKEGGDRRDSRDSQPRREFNDRPAQSSSFAKPASDNGDIKKQMAEISMKLDRLTLAIERMSDKKREAPIVIKEAPKAEAKAEVKTVAKKAPSLKTVIKKATVVKAPVKKVAAKKVVAKKK